MYFNELSAYMEEKDLSYTFNKEPCYVKYFSPESAYDVKLPFNPEIQVHRAIEDPTVYMYKVYTTYYPMEAGVGSRDADLFYVALLKYYAEELDIPLYLAEAVQAYVSYLYFSSSPAQDQQQLAALHYSRFREACLRVDEANLLRTGYEPTNTLLEDRGWR